MSDIPKTVRVRIRVAVDKLGQWAAAGLWRYDDAKAQDLIFIDDLEPGEAYHWIEADVPVPPEEQVIAGLLMPTEDTP